MMDTNKKDQEYTAIELEALTEAQEIAVRIVMFEGALRYHERLFKVLRTLDLPQGVLETLADVPLEG